MAKTLNIYGTIVEEKVNSTDVAAVDVKNFLSSVSANEPVNVFINSYGGHVSAGLAIYNMLKAHKGKVTITVEGFACSIASVIAFAGDTLKMCESSLLMVHLPWTFSVGNKFEFHKTIEALEALEKTILAIYNANLSCPEHEQTIKDKTYAETWLSANEASKYFDLEICNNTSVTEKELSNSALKTVASKGESEQFKQSVLNRLSKNGTDSTTMQTKGKKEVRSVLSRFAKSERTQVDKQTNSILEKLKRS